MGSTAKRLDTSAERAVWLTGVRAKGEFRCGDCGYGVTVYRELPACPMCRGETWERVAWRPYTRRYQQH
jgi:hypothetical protein